MKKTVGTLIAILLICCLLPIPVQAAESSAAITEYRTSYNESDYFDFQVSGSTLTVSGVSPESRWLLVEIAGERLPQFKTIGKKQFSETFRLNAYQKDEPVTINIASGADQYGTYQYLFYDGDVVINYANGSWEFESALAILNNNLSMYEDWVNPADALGEEFEDEVMTLSEKIVGEETDEYKTLRLIHDWVADNIYYDYDYFYGKVERSLLYTVAEIIEKKYAVCEGYATLTKALLQAQGIPCIKVTGYALGIGTDGGWTEDTMAIKKSNHAWNEAFVDGRWVVLDVTWDSGNKYENGEFIYEGLRGPKYFDISQEQFAKDHKLLRRLYPKSTEIPADWAKSEIKDAFSHELIPYALQSDYSAKITREEFCTMAVQLIEAREDADIKTVLEEKGLSSTSVFKDTSDEAILAAYALGIVKGKGNGLFVPNGEITRQEAAVMLEKTAKVLGLNDLDGVAVDFADSEKFASWATASIGFVSALSDEESGNLVMGGVGEGNFSPGSAYTREQSCCTMLRLYHVLTQMAEIEDAVAS